MPDLTPPILIFFTIAGLTIATALGMLLSRSYSLFGAFPCAQLLIGRFSVFCARRPLHCLRPDHGLRRCDHGAVPLRDHASGIGKRKTGRTGWLHPCIWRPGHVGGSSRSCVYDLCPKSIHPDNLHPRNRHRHRSGDWIRFIRTISASV